MAKTTKYYMDLMNKRLNDIMQEMQNNPILRHPLPKPITLINQPKQVNIMTSNNDLKSGCGTYGVNLIANERLEQIEKHGFGLSHDIESNDWVDLRAAAMYALTLEGTYYPKHWEPWFAVKMQSKTIEERITIAGALLAASLDLMKHEDEQEQSDENN